MTGAPSLCIVDWGSTNGRAWVVSDSSVVDHTTWSEGILFEATGDKRVALSGHLADLLSRHDVGHIIGVGMLGSRNGIHEVDYLHTPLSLQEWIGSGVAAGSLAGIDLTILPGVMTDSSLSGLVSVMRGEEFEFFSAVDPSDDCGWAVLPGTHSKWLAGSDATIANFETIPTGEMFRQWSQASSLSALMESDQLTATGVQVGLSLAHHEAPLTAALFSLRARVVTGGLALKDLRGALSGLLIGTEVRQALGWGIESGPVVVVGGGEVVEIYRLALQEFGVKAITAEVSPERLSRTWAQQFAVRSSA